MNQEWKQILWARTVYSRYKAWFISCESMKIESNFNDHDYDYHCLIFHNIDKMFNKKQETLSQINACHRNYDKMTIA